MVTLLSNANTHPCMPCIENVPWHMGLRPTIILYADFWKTEINRFFSTFSKGIWTQPEFVMDILTAMVVKMKRAAYANLGSIFAAVKEPKVGHGFMKF